MSETLDCLKTFQDKFIIFTTETKYLTIVTYWKKGLFLLIIPEVETVVGWLRLFRPEENRVACRKKTVEEEAHLTVSRK